MTGPTPPVDALSKQGNPGDSTPLAGVRVLLAEDNPTNQRIAIHMLRRLGCVAILVADGAEVLDRLDQESFDLVLMDVQMPRVDGLQATREIRRREASGWVSGGGTGASVRLPVIAITANASPRDRELCLAAQMDDYLSKPVTIEQLARVLIYWVEQARGWAIAQVGRPGFTQPPPPVLRCERLEEVSLGDADFEREFLTCLLTDLATGLDQLQQAHEPFDPVRTASVLHSIVGACRTVGADALGLVARELEIQARQPEFQPIAAWLDPLHLAHEQLVAGIAAHLGSKPA